MFRPMFDLIIRQVMMVESTVNKRGVLLSTGARQIKKQVYSAFSTLNDCNFSEQNYENAINALNSLQSNQSALQDSIQRKHQDDSRHISEAIKFLERIDIKQSALAQLPVIHVSGTKGKGSTCAMIESILRKNGYRTGFFSSPHLVTVTERIRLNGTPISADRFAEYFWKIYNRLLATREHDHDLPSYFNFLTIMAMDVFVREQLDVCVIEVGVGGRYDSTNVVQNTKIVGITSLGLEHTKLLGETLEEIAWQKAGIIKNGSDVFTPPQPPECLEVIERECRRMHATLHITPYRLDDYTWPTKKSSIVDKCEAMEINTSLAIQVACSWMRRTSSTELPTNPMVLTEKIVEGIDRCFWPGRLQIIPYGNLRTLYLDGAHTVESMDVCAKWFSSKTQSHHTKLLVFNTTGDRDSLKLLSMLSRTVKFDCAFFTPNVALCTGNQIDTVNHNFPIEQQSFRCDQHCAYWREQLGNADGFVHKSVESVFEQIEKKQKSHSALRHYDILITGSIHLLGATLIALKMEKHASGCSS